MYVSIYGQSSTKSGLIVPSMSPTLRPALGGDGTLTTTNFLEARRNPGGTNAGLSDHGNAAGRFLQPLRAVGAENRGRVWKISVLPAPLSPLEAARNVSMAGKAYRTCSSQIFARMALRVTMLRRRTAAGGSSGCPVRRCSDARPGFIVSHFERAAIRLRSGPGAPTDDERAREYGIGKIDRDGVVKHPAHARWRHRPAIRAAIFVQPSGDFSIAAPETL